MALGHPSVASESALGLVRNVTGGSMSRPVHGEALSNRN
jgi:hypothetical protein